VAYPAPLPTGSTHATIRFNRASFLRLPAQIRDGLDIIKTEGPRLGGAPLYRNSRRTSQSLPELIAQAGAN
jgi:hypothetical protein